MLIVVAAGFLLALLAPLLYRIAGRATGGLLAALPGGLFVYLLSHSESIRASQPQSSSIAWAPQFALSLSFRLDGLSLLFSLLITGMGALVLIYSGGYMAGHRMLGRFYAFILAFMASMLGLVLADNFLGLYVFWELTTFTSFLLIGFEHEREAARAAALRALLTTTLGGLALLAGLLLLKSVTGVNQFSALEGQAFGLHNNALYIPVLVLILLGTLTKSAQYPFHFWLPGAMEAPTPVSAYLHSATMVKAGIYLLARLHSTLAGTEAWFWTLTSLGGLTMLLGSWLALRSSDLKQILAYSTLSVLGMLVVLLGVGTAQALIAMSATIIAHALYKGTLFLVAGAIDHSTHTRQIDELGNLARRMPITSLAWTLGGISMMGIIPTLGFVSKELLYEAVQHTTTGAIPLTIAMCGANALLVAVVLLLVIGPLWRTAPCTTPYEVHEASPELWMGPIVLSSGGLALGIWPGWLSSTLITPSASVIAATDIQEKVALWHGFNVTLLLSLLTLAVGACAYWIRHPLRRVGPVGHWLANSGPRRWYDGSVTLLNTVALWQTRVLQNGYLRGYLAIIFVSTVGLLWWSVLRETMRLPIASTFDVRLYEAAIAATVVLATSLAVVARSRLAAITGMGAVGFAISAIYVLYGAPDLAMTQFMVETLTVILMTLVFLKLPRFQGRSTWRRRVRDGVISLSVGISLASLLLISLHARELAPISQMYIEKSVSEAHGRNIVNVILVDFRALDTLGEITVLSAAGIGVHALLKLRLEPRG